MRLMFDSTSLSLVTSPTGRPRWTFAIPAKTPAAQPTPTAPPRSRFALKPLPEGRPATEANDCSVVAMAIATGCTYAEAHAALQRAGRPARKGVPHPVLSAALGLPYQRSAPLGTPREKLPTLTQWVAQHRRGTFIVFYTGHFTVVRNGAQLDTYQQAYKPRARVSGHWQVA